ncbi:MAG: hypothetical protein Q9215_000068 [Flavoplaca cf. flavocitrina]
MSSLLSRNYIDSPLSAGAAAELGKLRKTPNNDQSWRLITRKLSAATLALLGDFYSEREENKQQFEDLKAQNEDERLQTPLSMTLFTEDWNASQFWYSDETAVLLAEQLLRDSTKETRIAVVSAPSVFIQLKNILVRGN